MVQSGVRPDKITFKWEAEGMTKMRDGRSAMGAIKSLRTAAGGRRAAQARCSELVWSVMARFKLHAVCQMQDDYWRLMAVLEWLVLELSSGLIMSPCLSEALSTAARLLPDKHAVRSDNLGSKVLGSAASWDACNCFGKQYCLCF